MKRILLALLVLGTAAAAASAQEALSPEVEETGPAPPAKVAARDTPNDAGNSVTVSWAAVPGVVRYRIERAGADGEFSELDFAGSVATSYVDQAAATGTAYRYRVVALFAGGGEAVSGPTSAVASSPQWFNSYLTGVALAIVLFVGTIVYFVRRAKRGEHLFVRRIAGLEAVDEAVGRATEMGRPILFVSGTGYIESIGTIAALNVLGQVAKKTAEYGTKLAVPNCDPVVFTVSREVVKGAYTEAGHPDAYDPNSVSFLVENRLSYSAAVSGILVREQPAANFFLGPFGGESLILAETGSTTGAIQISGTDSTTQLPFFVVACDYTLMGEELYAASAYLSREPLMLGALKGEDWGKFIFMVILTLGTIISLAAGIDVGKILSTTGY